MADQHEITVLWLPEWYPGRTQPANGDFIERHAKAVSTFVRVIVLFVGKDERLLPHQVETEKEFISPRLIVYRVWYGSMGLKSNVEKLWSFWRFGRLQRKMYRRILEENGPVDLVHVHVALKAGLLALHLNGRGIPYLLTEHWTGYYFQHTSNIYQAGKLLQRLNRSIIEKAALLMPVSAAQGDMIVQHIAPVKYTTIDNVVNTDIFFYRPFTVSPFRFIHASYLNFQKNPEGMIHAAAALAQQGHQFELVLIGNENKALMDLADKLQILNSYVFIRPAVPHEQVAAELQRSSALLMFSRFENQPCIILEALCCGLPVISTATGGISELINADNGILICSEDQEGLVQAMKQMMETYNSYDRQKIAAHAASRFNEQAIGQEHLQRYRQVLKDAMVSYGNRS